MNADGCRPRHDSEPPYILDCISLLKQSPNVGLRILEYIKAHLPESKVLVMTSSSGIETRKACYAVGADEFLDKPFDIEQLLSTMRRMAPRSLDLT